MIVSETSLKGSYIIHIEKKEDERGFCAHSWDKLKLKEAGLNTDLAQCLINYNYKKGTLRGMHYQLEPHREAKFVRCTKGRIYDVIIDLRSNSETFKKWISMELSEDNHKIIYVPEGFAHGFQTLEDKTEVFYQISEYHKPEFEMGVRWDDKTFNIDWPIKNPIISEKDRSHKIFDK